MRVLHYIVDMLMKSCVYWRYKVWWIFTFFMSTFFLSTWRPSSLLVNRVCASPNIICLSLIEFTKHVQSLMLTVSIVDQLIITQHSKKPLDTYLGVKQSLFDVNVNLWCLMLVLLIAKWDLKAWWHKQANTAFSTYVIWHLEWFQLKMELWRMH